MKNIIVSLLIVVAGIFSFNTAKAQNPHYNSGPCLSADGRTITAVATGLGTGPITVVCTGQSDCINPGGNEPPSWQNFSLTQNIAKSKGGNFQISISLASLCNRRWTTVTQGLALTIWYDNGSKSFGPISVNTNCQ